MRPGGSSPHPPDPWLQGWTPWGGDGGSLPDAGCRRAMIPRDPIEMDPAVQRVRMSALRAFTASACEKAAGSFLVELGMLFEHRIYIKQFRRQGSEFFFLFVLGRVFERLGGVSSGAGNSAPCLRLSRRRFRKICVLV